MYLSTTPFTKKLKYTMFKPIQLHVLRFLFVDISVNRRWNTGIHNAYLSIDSWLLGFICKRSKLSTGIESFWFSLSSLFESYIKKSNSCSNSS
mmetsp:Transcript_7894/g.7489  ORF Transcript_7894/g.7489 Transcript_7894/m.7489 type:complete len:93 (-) Transcript_7894:1115-1393(-)